MASIVAYTASFAVFGAIVAILLVILWILLNTRKLQKIARKITVKGGETNGKGQRRKETDGDLPDIDTRRKYQPIPSDARQGIQADIRSAVDGSDTGSIGGSKQKRKKLIFRRKG